MDRGIRHESSWQGARAKSWRQLALACDATAIADCVPIFAAFFCFWCFTFFSSSQAREAPNMRHFSCLVSVWFAPLLPQGVEYALSATAQPVGYFQRGCAYDPRKDQMGNKIFGRVRTPVGSETGWDLTRPSALEIRPLYERRIEHSRVQARRPKSPRQKHRSLR